MAKRFDMRYTILVLFTLLAACFPAAHAQPTHPYAAFGMEGTVLQTAGERARYAHVVENDDEAATVRRIEIDPMAQAVRVYGLGDTLLATEAMGVTERGRFLSVDPLARSYPMLTPYQFASNSPIAGIDLDGLEYLDYRESMIELRLGEAKIKLENASRFTHYYVNSSRGVTRMRGGKEIYEHEVSTYLGSFQYDYALLNASRQAMPAQGPELIKTRTSGPNGGNSEQRRAWRRQYTRKGLPLPTKNLGRPPTGDGGSGLGGALIVAEGIDLWRSYSILGDLKRAREQLGSSGVAAYNAVDASIGNGLVIPEALRTPEAMSDITNYVLQGEINGSYSSDNREQLISVAKIIMYENGVPTRDSNGDLEKTSSERP